MSLLQAQPTVDEERFAGLNICGFSAIGVFAEIFLCCFGHKYSSFSIVKEKLLYSRKNVRSTPENREKHEVQPSESFPVYDIILCSKFYLYYAFEQCSITLPVMLNIMPITTAIIPQFIHFFSFLMTVLQHSQAAACCILYHAIYAAVLLYFTHYA